MARLPRLALAGELHQVALRGHNGGAAFTDEADRTDFLAMLRQAALEQDVAVHAYVLLDAQVRLLCTPARADALGRLMQSLGRRYVLAFNRRHGRRGTLWEGRFRSGVIDAAHWLLDATVLIEDLPVQSGLVAAAGDWRWSSAAHHLGRLRDPVVTEHGAYWSLGNTPFERELAHARLLAHGIERPRAEQLERALQQGLALGSGAFLAKLAETTSRPLTARPRGRPRAS
ncbi:MAG TPA: transposase [Burkholderiaceae bacterium]|nr:transposase [Burkholderiaceae bacterium]